MLEYFKMGLGVGAGVLVVVLAGLIILGVFDKLKELMVIARALRKREGKND